MDINSLISKTISVVPSPYMGSNLILTYKVETGTFTTDSVGNQAPVIQSVIIQASVTKERTPLDVPQASGGDLSEFRVKGRLITPKLMPTNITLQMLADAELTDGATGSMIQGTFRLVPINQTRFVQINEEMGSRLSGIFYVST